MRPVGQAAKTSPSHGENRGSIPLLAVLTKCDPVPIDRESVFFMRRGANGR